MTISDNYAPDRSSGDGSTLEFSGSWSPLVASYMQVFLEVKTTGVQTLQVQGSDYTLTFSSSGYLVTFVVAPPSTDYVIRARDVALSQEDPYKTSKGFQGQVIENSFDKLTAISQDNRDAILRTATFPIGSGESASFGPVTDQGVLYFDNGEIKSDGPTISDITDAAADAAASAAAALASQGAAAASESNANASASSASSSASAAATSATQAAGAVASVSSKYTFSNSTVVADPGTGKLLLNNATPASATIIAISTTDADTNVITAFLASLDDSTHNPRALLKIGKNNTNFAIYGINSANADHTGWKELNVSYIDGAGSFSNSDMVFFGSAISGNDGTGDMTLAGVQSVTGLKTFDKDKFAMKGTSTGSTVLSTANSSATNYTATLPAKDGTIAMLTDIVNFVGALTVMTTTGAGTWTAPADTTAATVFEFTVTGGGGGGGGAAGGSVGAGGGGAGATAIYYLAGLTANTAYTTAIGVGGAAGTNAPTNGTTGGTSSIILGGVTISCTGGTGGNSGGALASGVVGGVASITGSPANALYINGGNGAPTPQNSTNSGGGDGGTSFFGGPGSGGKSGAAGDAALTYGAGGGGAGGAANASGGAGKQGIIIIKRISG